MKLLRFKIPIHFIICFLIIPVNVIAQSNNRELINVDQYRSLSTDIIIGRVIDSNNYFNYGESVIEDELIASVDQDLTVTVLSVIDTSTDVIEGDTIQITISGAYPSKQDELIAERNNITLVRVTPSLSVSTGLYLIFLSDHQSEVMIRNNYSLRKIFRLGEDHKFVNKELNNWVGYYRDLVVNINSEIELLQYIFNDSLIELGDRESFYKNYTNDMRTGVIE
ncbi:MAG: hypothetical protein KKC01_09600 [Gammaproteobacteria bacterium]|nr:hypothetical protein [Gammaproteobacteria bacterium]